VPNLLFVHPNFPGQFKLIAGELAARAGYHVVGIGQGARRPEEVEKIDYRSYDKFTDPEEIVFPPLQALAENVRRGRSAADIFRNLKREGFQPDCIVSHPGWGDAIFLREIYPKTKFVAYLEFFYRANNSDVDFDPEFKPAEIDLQYTRLRNITNLCAFADCDIAITPTEWQASLLPQNVRTATRILHDGIDCSVAAPRAATFLLPNGGSLSKADEVVTYVARSLEPYRGFHIFMRALPELMKRRSNAQVVVVGSDNVSYGRSPRHKGSWKSLLLKEISDQIDLRRVHFLDRIPYPRFLDLLNVSSVHVYLTYPFVLSWSVLEAMACECAIVGSRTSPVEEVITDQENGLLVNFFSTAELIDAIVRLLGDTTTRARMGKAARRVIATKYDFKSRILPEYLKIIENSPYKVP
jgi:glycosyltransferase involved in cell wall biosynthesis